MAPSKKNPSKNPPKNPPKNPKNPSIFNLNHSFNSITDTSLFKNLLLLRLNLRMLLQLLVCKLNNCLNHSFNSITDTSPLKNLLLLRLNLRMLLQLLVCKLNNCLILQINFCRYLGISSITETRTSPSEQGICS
jgi:hypothetical protein